MPSSLLSQLREQTSQAHAKLEVDVDISARLEDVGRYRQLLEKFYGFYKPLEDQYATYPEWQAYHISMPERKKAAWMEHDLKTLGLTDAGIANLPVADPLPDTSTFARALGCAYVLEGSTLGGRHIAAMLAKSDIPAEATRFYQGYGPETGSQWKSFCAALEQYGTEREDVQETVDAATSTFECLQVWMGKPQEGSHE